jgi:hypothetical protein
MANDLEVELDSYATRKLNALYQSLLKRAKETRKLTEPYTSATERTRYAGQLTQRILQRVTGRILA